MNILGTSTVILVGIGCFYIGYREAREGNIGKAAWWFLTGVVVLWSVTP